MVDALQTLALLSFVLCLVSVTALALKPWKWQPLGSDLDSSGVGEPEPRFLTEYEHYDARLLATCNGFVWMPGMLDLRGWRCHAVDVDGRPSLWFHDDELHPGGSDTTPAPCFDDAATAGCVEFQARAAWKRRGHTLNTEVESADGDIAQTRFVVHDGHGRVWEHPIPGNAWGLCCIEGLSRNEVHRG